MRQVIIFISISNFKLQHYNSLSLSLSLNKWFPTSFPRLKFSPLLWILFCLIPWYSVYLSPVFCFLDFCLLLYPPTSSKSTYEQAACLPPKMWLYPFQATTPPISLSNLAASIDSSSQGFYSPPCSHSAFFIYSISIFELLFSFIVQTGGTSKTQFLLWKASLVRDTSIVNKLKCIISYTNDTFIKLCRLYIFNIPPQTTFHTVINVYLSITNLRTFFLPSLY